MITEDTLEPEDGADKNEDWLFSNISFDRAGDDTTDSWDDAYSNVLKEIEKGKQK